VDLRGVFGQQLSIRRIQEWIGENAWKTSVLFLNGPTGSGKSLLCRLTFPDAIFFDFNTFATDAFQAAFCGFLRFSADRIRNKKALVISDFSCLPEKSQQYIVDVVVYYADKVKHIPLPVIFIFDDIPARMSMVLARFSRRITVSRLSQKSLMALGFDICRRAGLSSERLSRCVADSAGVASNARHFISILEKKITGRDSVVGVGCPGDVSFSPFDLVRKTWSVKPAVPIDKIVDMDGSETGLLHWLAANTAAAFGLQGNPLAALCDDYSLFDTMNRKLFSHGNYSVRFATAQSTRVAVSEFGYGQALVNELPVAYPDSLRREYPVPKKSWCDGLKSKPLYLKNPGLSDVFNKFYN
jgi:hypothetical protein